MKKILILGGGGFIGGHLSKRMKDSGFFVRTVDIKKHDFFEESQFCNEFYLGDLRDTKFVEEALTLSSKESFDEVYQLRINQGTL